MYIYKQSIIYEEYIYIYLDRVCVYVLFYILIQFLTTQLFFRSPLPAPLSTFISYQSIQYYYHIYNV